MATVTPKLTISSSDLLSQPVNISVSSSITATSGGVERRKVAQTAVHADAVVLFTASDFSAPAYLFVKNTETTVTNYVYVYDDTTSGDPVILKLGGGQFAWMPLNAGLTIKAYGTSADSIVEFGLFGTDA
tara:strand:+ start:758 stop:1147 length:390 start_codon:yes stop_codon:yes gene_type:complete